MDSTDPSIMDSTDPSLTNLKMAYGVKYDVIRYDRNCN